MCLQRPNDLTDNLGNRLEPLDFVDEDNDTCDYFDLDEDHNWIYTENDFTVLQINIRGLLNKQNDLLKLTNEIAGKQKIDVMILQETWLTNANQHLVQIPGYKHYVKYRTGKKGGGVSILVSSELTSRLCNNIECNETYLESCNIEIQLPQTKLLISSVYRLPNMSEKQFNSAFEKLMKSICKSSSHSIIGLDHNLDLLKANYHKPTQSFLENVLSNQHVPCITRPTRITKSSATLIDNILVSRDIYNNTKYGIAISDLSDHFPCIMTWPNIIKNKRNHITFNVKKFDQKHVSALQDYLRHDWQILEMIEDANDAYQLFHSRLENSINKFTEEKTVKISYKKIVKQPWLTKGIIKANRKQTKLYKEWLTNKNAITHDRYKHYRDALRKIKRRQKVKYYNSQCDRYK